eukprot:388508-Amphidinium_carterae.1
MSAIELRSAGPTADFPEADPATLEDTYDAQGILLDPDKDFFYYVPEAECQERQGKPYSVALKWVDKNKWDKVRSRIVVREVDKRAKTEEEKLEPKLPNDMFSATPPSKRTRTTNLWCLPCTTSPVPTSTECTARIAQRRRCGEAQQDDVRDTRCLERVAKFKTWGDHLQENGFTLGSSNPGLFCSDTTKGFCHRDDFVIACSEENAEAFGALLRVKFEVKLVGLIKDAPRLAKQLEVLISHCQAGGRQR